MASDADAKARWGTHDGAPCGADNTHRVRPVACARACAGERAGAAARAWVRSARVSPDREPIWKRTQD